MDQISLSQPSFRLEESDGKHPLTRMETMGSPMQALIHKILVSKRHISWCEREIAGSRRCRRLGKIETRQTEERLEFPATLKSCWQWS